MAEAFLLPKIQLNLLVSVYNKIIEVDCWSQTVKDFFVDAPSQTQTNGPWHYGITWADGLIYIISSTEPAKDLRNRHNQVQRLDRQGYLIDTFPIPIGIYKAHQIQIWDNSLWITDTGNNLIHKVPLSDSEGDSYILPGTQSGKDFNHLNSLWFEKDCAYFLGHNYGPSILWVCSYPDMKEIRQIHVGHSSHNIFKMNSLIHLCDSQKARILDETGHTQIRFDRSWWPRGIALTPEHLIIGLSSFKDKRMDRPTVDTAIKVFDHSYQNIGTIKLPGLGQIMEIRCTNTTDFAHHGVPLDAN